MLGVTCLECHGPTKQKGDLRIDSRAALLTGGASGPAITPGRGDDSLLIQRLRGLGGDPRMPKKKDPLSDATISQIAQWIDDGAPWPDSVRIAAP
jgi:mono/diheme cytochrome c family protein